MLNQIRAPKGAFCQRLAALDPTLTRQQLAEIWNLLDPKGLNVVELEQLYNFLCGRFGKDKKSSSTNSGVIERVRARYFSVAKPYDSLLLVYTTYNYIML